MFWGMQFTRSLPHCVVNEPRVLFPSNGANFVQSHTAITSIVILRIAESNKQNGKNIADSANQTKFAESRVFFRHCEKSHFGRLRGNLQLCHFERTKLAKNLKKSRHCETCECKSWQSTILSF
ncbi:hypothetical protein [Helicobacter sp. 23-1045]